MIQFDPTTDPELQDSDELDLLDIKDAAPQAPRALTSKRPISQNAIVILVLTAVVSFALGMLAERLITPAGVGDTGLTGAGSSASAAKSLDLNAAATHPIIPTSAVPSYDRAGH